MGCRVCRARKVKCDGRPNGCRNCERLQLDCVDDTLGLASPTAGRRASLTSLATSSLRKTRTYRSCTSCRLSKTKCNGDRPRCARCGAKGIDCVYDGGSTPRWAKNFSPASQGVKTEEDVEGGGEGVEAPPKTPLLVEPSDSLQWLLSPEIPPPRQVRRLVEHYFANIHPIRCFAFVHKPSFMRQLDNGINSEDDSALLHITCAHGAKFHALSLGQFDQMPSEDFVRAAGNQWATKAEAIVLSHCGKISIHRLMATVLLCDFRHRQGEHSQALMLGALAIRAAQSLKLHRETSADILCIDTSSPSVVPRESRRRLMWACYLLDAWNTDPLITMKESEIKIQLPCNERNFGLRIASVTETLGVGHVLQCLSPAMVPRKPADNMGIMAYYIRIVTLWKRISNYVSKPDTGPAPWLPSSEFAALDADMSRWRRELPEFVEYSPDTIYARLDSNQLGALMLIHCTYHHAYLELYKIALPELYGLPNSPTFPPEQNEAWQALQAESYFHARQIAHLLAEAAEHGPRLLSDAALPWFALESSRVMMYYVGRILPAGRVDVSERVKEAVEATEANVELLKIMGALFPVSTLYASTVSRWLSKMRQGVRDLSPRMAEEHVGLPDIEMSSFATSHKALSGFTLPPIAFHDDHANGPQMCSSTHPMSTTTTAIASKATSSPPHWDTAQHLVDLSRGHTPPKCGGLCASLDLDDLRNFLREDMLVLGDGSLASSELESAV
ncbi:uncharacterized protein F5Z01DRAFT_674653 [Emericellopsis atlantica]|uniref:Zn(2)-C6 fungal-type domain-containing protein n=1 Tax=Emericellopsis atlantica TaxID=2614577 RepID=A0A9P8CP54_9HYPO|nr:uncharacterized protein F5Z01DRAFT_674653 [Emericellopsis atlantica]KAG9253770.1 hypothetical protein F5Z01DRAFT_674653 [Emericellopsis atlantica]